MDAKWGRGRMNLEIVIDIYTPSTLCIKQITCETSCIAQGTVETQMGRKSKKEGTYVCIH